MEESVSSLLKQIEAAFGRGVRDTQPLSPLALAYVGDGIYDIVIRTIIAERGNAPVNQLHKKVSSIVKAQAQAELLHIIEPHLNEEEQTAFRRGRNAKSATSAKNASITDYRIATGLEALMGYLYLKDDTGRIVELVKLGLDGIEQKKAGR